MVALSCQYTERSNMNGEEEYTLTDMTDVEWRQVWKSPDGKLWIINEYDYMMPVAMVYREESLA